MKRYAVVYKIKSSTLEAYLPSNYSILSGHAADPFGGTNYVIHGRDEAGWTLDDYVIPRLASGLYFGREYPSHYEAVEAAAGAMR